MNLNKIKEGLKKLFFIKKSETYLTRYPDIRTRKELAEFINKKTEQENAQLKAQLLKKKEREQEKKREELERKKEELIEAQIRKKIEQEERLTKQRALKLRIEGLFPPTFFLRSNLPYHKFMGIYLQEDRDGRLLWYPWLRKGKQDFMFPYPATNFLEFFKERVGIVSQMRGGKVDSNFDIVEGKKPILIAKDIAEDKEGKKYEVIHLEDAERQELEREVETYKNKYYEALGRIKDLGKNEKKMEGKLAEQEITTEMAVEEADISRANLSVLSKKQTGMIGDVANMLSSRQDSEISRILSLRMQTKLITINDELNRYLEEKLPDKPIEREEILSTVQKIVKNAIEQKTIIVQQPPTK